MVASNASEEANGGTMLEQYSWRKLFVFDVSMLIVWSEQELYVYKHSRAMYDMYKGLCHVECTLNSFYLFR